MEKPHILIIDDDPMYMTLAETALGKENYTFTRAYLGQEGLKKTQESKPDLILLDWELPDAEGPDICKLIKRHPDTKDIPVIMLTSRMEISNKVDGLDSGADDYVTKPYAPEELAARVKAFLRRKHQIEELITSHMDKLNKYIPAGLKNDLKMQENKPQAQEKIISVLFADLCGFTNMTSSMTPEKIHSFLNDYFKFLAEIIYKNNGSIDKFIGDAVMAIFSSNPTKDACNAISAAFEMRDNISKLADGKYGKLQIRVGINTGPAIVSMVGTEERADFTAVGSTVNFAAKLQKYGIEGQILVGPETKRQTANTFSFKTLEIKELPFESYELIINNYETEN